ncbi:MAG: AMP-binding protein [Candidatus Atribacteria bacterium]|nr:AMP-binding protein [Candidatus Atribacteria bacterium]
MSRTTTERIREMSQDYGKKIAVSQGDWFISYNDLVKEIDKEAGKLKKAGIKEGMLVVIVLPTHWHTLRLFLGCFQIGAIPLPLSPKYPPKMIEKTFHASDASLVVAQSQFQELLERLPLAIMGENGEIRFPSTVRNFETPLPVFDSPIAAFFSTSGTTGTPKIVMLTHKNILSDIDSCFDLVDIYPEDRMLGLLPMFHVFGFSIAYMLPLAKGMTLTIVPAIYPATNLIESLKKYQSTVFLGVPAIFSILAGARAKASFDLNPLRLPICGGDALPSRVRKAFERGFGLNIMEGYGITEASPVVSINPSPLTRIPGSAGPVISEINLQVVDDNGKTLTVGEVGEIILSGSPVSPGYFNNPEENEHAFRGKWFYTGDLGKLDEKGNLYIEGRKKELIIVSGFNVFPQEIEEVIMGIPGVARTAVVGVQRASRGEMVKAYVVPGEGGWFWSVYFSLASGRREPMKSRPLINPWKYSMISPRLPITTFFSIFSVGHKPSLYFLMLFESD